MSKIKKPNMCELCPVCKHIKNEIVCGVKKDNKAKTNSNQEKFIMWKKCPLDWD